MCSGKANPSILPKLPAPPAAQNISLSPRIRSPIILIQPVMPCSVIWPKPGIRFCGWQNDLFIRFSRLERVGGIPTGRLSGIVNHHVPRYLRTNQLPSYETNCIEDWETKLNKIVDETINKDMTLISGIPPWMQMYFDELMKRSGKKIGELFPNFSVMVQGGVNFEPYKAKLFESIGKKIDSIELFPASEGFFAFQDSQNAEGLLLNTNSGIFFEFVPAGEIYNENPTRLSLRDVKVGENYALIINSNAGLWGYNLGDTVKFVSTNPYRLVVTGRTKHFISAFGEHVIGEEVEHSLLKAAEEENIHITEFTVAPFVSEGEGKSYHEWFIEFENKPRNIQEFARKVDETCVKRMYIMMILSVVIF